MLIKKSNDKKLLNCEIYFTNTFSFNNLEDAALNHSIYDYYQFKSIICVSLPQQNKKVTVWVYGLHSVLHKTR